MTRVAQIIATKTNDFVYFMPHPVKTYTTQGRKVANKMA